MAVLQVELRSRLHQQDLASVTLPQGEAIESFRINRRVIDFPKKTANVRELAERSEDPVRDNNNKVN